MTTSGPTVRDRVDGYFGIGASGSTVRTEVLGGLSTFLAMSYIVLVNPAILAKGGFPWYAAFVATALISGLATVAMGLWARLPFAVAPGMEINALVVFSVIGAHGFTWQQALGLVFWSGVLMIAVTAAGLRGRVVDAIPEEVRPGLVLSVGAFVGLVGLKVAGLVGGGPWPQALVAPSAIALYLGFGVACVLHLLGVRVAVLAGIVVAAGYCALAGLRADPLQTGAPTAALFDLDLSVLFSPVSLGLVLVLFALDFFGSVAKFVGLSENTPIQRDGAVPRLEQALHVDGVATVAGAAAGSTSFVTFVESGVGIRAGARTGLAAVVTGVLLLCCLAFAPLLGWLPAAAASGALLFVAFSTLPAPARIRSSGGFALVTGLVMAVLTVLTSALDQALLAGLLLHVGRDLMRRKRPDTTVLVVAGLLVVSVALQYSA